MIGIDVVVIFTDFIDFEGAESEFGLDSGIGQQSKSFRKCDAAWQPDDIQYGHCTTYLPLKDLRIDSCFVLPLFR